MKKSLWYLAILFGSFVVVSVQAICAFLVTDDTIGTTSLLEALQNAAMGYMVLFPLLAFLIHVLMKEEEPLGCFCCLMSQVTIVIALLEVTHVLGAAILGHSVNDAAQISILGFIMMFFMGLATMSLLGICICCTRHTQPSVQPSAQPLQPEAPQGGSKSIFVVVESPDESLCVGTSKLADDGNADDSPV